LPGIVEAHSGRADGVSVVKASVGEDGRFSISLPAGTYVLTGSSPKVSGVPCLSPPVVVGNNFEGITVACNIR